MEAGADYFFDKSTDFEKLKAVLQVLSEEPTTLSPKRR
jgi:hypothetical protein